jgi:hypothetical protein
LHDGIIIAQGEEKQNFFICRFLKKSFTTSGGHSSSMPSQDQTGSNINANLNPNQQTIQPVLSPGAYDLPQGPSFLQWVINTTINDYYDMINLTLGYVKK